MNYLENGPEVTNRGFEAVIASLEFKEDTSKSVTIEKALIPKKDVVMFEVVFRRGKKYEIDGYTYFLKEKGDKKYLIKIKTESLNSPY